MRIALIAHLHFPIREPFKGGLERHTHMLAAALVARGHDVTLFAAPGSTAAGVFHAVDQYSFEPEATGEAARQQAQDGEAAYHYVCDAIRDGGFDVVHNNSLHYIPMMRAHTMGAPVVQVMHTPFFWELEAGAAVARRHDSIRYVSVSDATGRDWAPYVGEYTVVPNGIDLPTWTYADAPERDLVVFCGRIVPEKAPHLAIDAARVAGKRIVIAGPKCDPAYFTKEIEPRLGPGVKYVGHLTETETVRLLGRAACMLFSSVWPEPFGYVLAEALNCGTPVAGFAVGASREVLSDEVAVLVEPGNVEALATAIEEASWLDRGVCHDYATTHFGLDLMIGAYEQIYREEVARFRKTRLAADGRARRPRLVVHRERIAA